MTFKPRHSSVRCLCKRLCVLSNRYKTCWFQLPNADCVCVGIVNPHSQFNCKFYTRLHYKSLTLNLILIWVLTFMRSGWKTFESKWRAVCGRLINKFVWILSKAAKLIINPALIPLKLESVCVHTVWITLNELKIVVLHFVVALDLNRLQPFPTERDPNRMIFRIFKKNSFVRSE